MYTGTNNSNRTVHIYVPDFVVTTHILYLRNTSNSMGYFFVFFSINPSIPFVLAFLFSHRLLKRERERKKKRDEQIKFPFHYNGLNSIKLPITEGKITPSTMYFRTMLFAAEPIVRSCLLLTKIIGHTRPIELFINTNYGNLYTVGLLYYKSLDASSLHEFDQWARIIIRS